jgi:AraC-like DNA-binding protein
MDILNFSKGTILDRKVSTTSIFFILDGLVEVTCGLISELIVEKNFFFVIPPEAKYSIRFLENGKIVRCQPGEDLLVEYISKTSYELYKTKCYQYESRDIFFLRIEKPIDRLLTDFIEVRCKKFSCERYFGCKCEELLILMVNYYPPEELTWLFHPVFEKKVVFKSIILMNRNKLFSVEEFAAAAHLNRESFRQYFKGIFGETPAKWIQRERADAVYKELAETDKSLYDIIRDYGFSNFPNFDRFCHMYLKKTPVAIRNDSREKEISD